MKRGTRGMGRIYERGGRWWIRYSHNGRRHDESSGSPKKPAAVALLKRRLEEAGKGRPIEEAKKTLLSDLKALIVADYKLHGRRSTKRLEQSWAHLAEFFGKGEPAIAITPARLALYVTRRTEEDGAAPATVQTELAALKRAFTLARKAGELLPNECPGFPTISVSNRRVGFLERADHELIKAHLPPDEAAVCEFLFWSAWRKGEALGLRWCDVDRKAGSIRIETTKTGQPRTLPYGALPALRRLIDERWKVTEAVQRKRGILVSFVFHRAGKPIRHLRRSWMAACVAAGLGTEVRDAKGRLLERTAFRILHDYRRSAARNMVRAGVPQSLAMAIGGWKTDSVFRRYAIADEVAMREGLARFAQNAPRVERSRVTKMKRAQ
jgi:integrase